MGRVKRWFFTAFFSCITKVKGKYSGKSSAYFRSNPRIIPENIIPVEDAWLPIPSSSTAVYMDIDDYRKYSSDSMNSTEEEEEQEKHISEEFASFSEEDSGNHQQAVKEGDSEQIPEQILDSAEEFSFWPWNDSKDIDICIADEIFSHGRLLPMGISSKSAGNTRPVHKNKPHQRRKVQIQFSEISHRFRLRNRKMSFWRFLRIGIMTMPEFQVHTSSFAPRSFF